MSLWWLSVLCGTVQCILQAPNRSVDDNVYPEVALTKVQHLNPSIEPGNFQPSTEWVFNRMFNQPNISSFITDTSKLPSISRQNVEGYGDYPPCGCGCGCGCPCGQFSTSTPPPAAFISTVPTSLTLTCETPIPYEHISWWLYKCPQSEENRNILQITSGSNLYFSGFEVSTGRNEKGFYSSLLIKDVSSNLTSGLYQCVSHSSTPTAPLFSQTDYFIIGKRTTMRDCLFDALSRKDFKRQIENRLDSHREPRQSENEKAQQIFVGNTLVFDFSDAIPDPTQSQPSESNDLQPPVAQNLTDIPIQNSSYIRFDFTGGQKIQNRDSSELPV